eukprot:9487892-Pyramimonas_sp.AAC.1
MRPHVITCLCSQSCLAAVAWPLLLTTRGSSVLAVVMRPRACACCRSMPSVFGPCMPLPCPAAPSVREAVVWRACAVPP